MIKINKKFHVIVILNDSRLQANNAWWFLFFWNVRVIKKILFVDLHIFYNVHYVCLGNSGAPCVRSLGDTIFDVFSQSISRLCTALKSLHFVTAINIRRHGMGREWVHCNVRWWWSVPTSWNMNPCDICLVMLSPHLLLAQRNMKTQDANKKRSFLRQHSRLFITCNMNALHITI